MTRYTNVWSRNMRSIIYKTPTWLKKVAFIWLTTANNLLQFKITYIHIYMGKGMGIDLLLTDVAKWKTNFAHIAY